MVLQNKILHRRNIYYKDTAIYANIIGARSTRRIINILDNHIPFNKKKTFIIPQLSAACINMYNKTLKLIYSFDLYLRLAIYPSLMFLYLGLKLMYEK